MRLFYLSFLFLCLTSFAYGMPLYGHGSLDTGQNTTPKHKILLIPFQPTMLMSEIGKEIHEKSNLSYSEITQTLRRELDLSLKGILGMNYGVVSLMYGKTKSDSVINYIYTSTGYKYDLLPGTKADTAGNPEYDPKKQKTHFIHNGQLDIPIDYSKRFMNITILSPALLSELYQRYHTDTFIFINELDIRNVNNPTQNLEEDNYRRQVTVQYSIMDTAKRYIAKGEVTSYFPFEENDIKVIGDKYLTVSAEQIKIKYEEGLLKLNTKGKIVKKHSNK